MFAGLSICISTTSPSIISVSSLKEEKTEEEDDKRKEKRKGRKETKSESKEVKVERTSSTTQL